RREVPVRHGRRAHVVRRLRAPHRLSNPAATVRPCGSATVTGMTTSAADHEWLRLEATDGRALETLVAGPRDGVPLVFHSGTQTAATPWPLLFDAAAKRG